MTNNNITYDKGEKCFEYNRITLLQQGNDNPFQKCMTCNNSRRCDYFKANQSEIYEANAMICERDFC